MRKTLALTALAAIVALAATDASASCQGRKNTGTAIGAVGGALLGNSISKGGGGAVIGGLGGAVVGHEVAKGGCGPSRHAYYRHGRSRYAVNDRDAAPARVYYDQHGNPVPVAGDYRR
jgi:hypothetical protein